MTKVDMITLRHVGGIVVADDRWSTAESLPPVDPAPCKNDVTDTKGTYNSETGAWSATFTRLLDTKDLCDTAILDKSTITMSLALGTDVAVVNMHTSVKEGKVLLTSDKVEE